MDIYKYINSKDVRKHLEEINYNTTITNGTYIKNSPENGVAFVEVKNSKSVLPQTGGAGYLVLYGIAGALAIAGAAVFFISRKKKHSNTDKT